MTLLDTVAIEPTNDFVEPRSDSLLPFSDIYLYLLMGGVFLVVLVVIVVTALVCCACVYKKSQRKFQGVVHRQPELNIDEPNMATSPTATNATFVRISPHQSNEDISVSDLKMCPQKELELGCLCGGIQSDVPIELRGLNTATESALGTSREPSGVFEEVDLSLEAPPPRYDDLDFEDSCEYSNTVLTSFEDREPTRKSSFGEQEEKELKFTTIRIGEL